MRSDRASLLDGLVALAREAAALVDEVYRTPFTVDYKGANDPVTRADRVANALIVERLARMFPGVPIISEEGDPSTFGGHVGADAAFFVDPLDGTKEFIARNGEFAVMIGLAERGAATVGVVACPANGRLFAGAAGVGAYELAGDTRRPLRVSRTVDPAQARLVASRSHREPLLDEVIARLAPGCVVPMGSAGVKAAAVAAAEADAYLQPGRAGKRWDTCAPEAIVKAAGGAVSDAGGAPLDYRAPDLENSRGLVVTNSLLHEAVLRAIADARRP